MEDAPDKVESVVGKPITATDRLDARIEASKASSGAPCATAPPHMCSSLPLLPTNPGARPSPRPPRRRRPATPARPRHNTTCNAPQVGKYFHLAERKTRFSREVRAGIVTFLTAW